MHSLKLRQRFYCDSREGKLRASSDTISIISIMIFLLNRPHSPMLAKSYCQTEPPRLHIHRRGERLTLHFLMEGISKHPADTSRLWLQSSTTKKRDDYPFHSHRNADRQEHILNAATHPAMCSTRRRSSHQTKPRCS